MMKNKTCLLIAAASILLAGCQETAVSSSSLPSEPDSSLSSSDPSSSSLPDVSEDVDAKKQAIVDFIDRAEEGTNYTYAFTDGSAFVSNPTIMTPEYISYPSEQMARAALPSYEGDGSKLLYDIDKAEGEYSVVVAARSPGPASRPSRRTATATSSRRSPSTGSSTRSPIRPPLASPRASSSTTSRPLRPMTIRSLRRSRSKNPTPNRPSRSPKA